MILPLAKGSESLGRARVETTNSLSVSTSHPTIGDLPCDLRDLLHDQEALSVLPFYSPVHITGSTW